MSSDCKGGPLGLKLMRVTACSHGHEVGKGERPRVRVKVKGCDTVGAGSIWSHLPFLNPTPITQHPTPSLRREGDFSMKEYSELMNLLLYFRERYQSEEEFRRFALKEIRSFIYDLRDLDIEISLSYASVHPGPANRWRVDRSLAKKAGR